MDFCTPHCYWTDEAGGQLEFQMEGGGGGGFVWWRPIREQISHLAPVTSVGCICRRASSIVSRSPPGTSASVSRLVSHPFPYLEPTHTHTLTHPLLYTQVRMSDGRQDIACQSDTFPKKSGITRINIYESIWVWGIPQLVMGPNPHYQPALYWRSRQTGWRMESERRGLREGRKRKRDESFKRSRAFDARGEWRQLPWKPLPASNESMSKWGERERERREREQRRKQMGGTRESELLTKGILSDLTNLKEKYNVTN